MTSIQGLIHTGESRTRRPRTASHTDTPDNPLDTRMDHTAHSLGTHRTYQRTPAAIQLSDTELCNQCVKTDTLQHRITDCGEGAIIWNWTRARIAVLLRIDPRYIPDDWTIRPYFQFWPPQRQAVIVWILAHPVEYRMQRKRRLTLNEYIDFLRRAKWKAYLKSPRQHSVGNILT